ncbi:pyrroline-5-carboxylate reductase [Lentisphaerota bacterium WC36G]|nr:pyrroline-5-carboxylate reductase [Lentisphaerae bacterium WC36]
MLNELKILFIGAGKMATAIAGGLITGSNDGAVKSENISAFDISEEALTAFKEKCPNATTECKDLSKVIDSANVVVVAVKPQYCANALSNFKTLATNTDNKLLISIVAGITIDSLQSLSGCSRVVRVMPNTPALINQGASGYSASGDAKVDDVNIAEAIFNCSGLAIKVSEDKLDAVTGVSGSGPAYVFEFIQSLIDGGILMGLTRDEAYKLAVQTVKGASILVEQTDKHPMILKEMVTSPGGTTAAALQYLKENSFNGVVAGAVKTATQKAAELGKE